MVSDIWEYLVVHKRTRLCVAHVDPRFLPSAFQLVKMIIFLRLGGWNAISQKQSLCTKMQTKMKNCFTSWSFETTILFSFESPK